MHAKEGMRHVPDVILQGVNKLNKKEA